MKEVSLAIAATVWSIASAMAVASLGGVMLGGGRSRPRGALAFGLFGLIWGIQLVLVNLARTATNVQRAEVFHLLSLACLLPLPYLVVEFAAAHARRTSVGWRLVRFAAAAVALSGAILLIAAPQFLVAGVFVTDGRVLPAWGVLHVPLVTVPFFLSFATALLALNRAKSRSPTPRVADRAAVLLGGLSLYVAFTAGNNLAFYLGSIIVLGGGAVPLAGFFTGVFLLLAVTVLWVGLTNLRAAGIAGSPSEARRDRLVAASALIPLALGAIEGYLALEAFPLLETVGLWRLAAVAVLAYGIARWRVYDLPERTKRAAANATGATAAVATGTAAYGAGALAATSITLPIVAGVLVVAASLLPALSFARRLFGVDASKRRDREQAIYGQRIEAYRAALEASLARDSLDEDREFLAALRERFGISPDEDRVLLHLARTSVIVARDTHAWDAYERLRLLGEGGGGRTWLARDRARDRLVVLKEPLARWHLDPAGRDAVLREARLAAKVRHANVVAVEEVVEGKGSPVIVMEYMEGGSLADLIRAKGTLAWPEARDIALDVLRGLEAIHAAGIVHRDVKPSNILLDGDGVAKVADFGIAVAPATSGERTMVIDPASSTIAGTMSYMAPEARAGGAPDRRSDLFACAAVLHEMLYGAPPGMPSPTVVRKDLPAAVPALLAHALEVKVESRFASARAFGDELSRVA